MKIAQLTLACSLLLAGSWFLACSSSDPALPTTSAGAGGTSGGGAGGSLASGGSSGGSTEFAGSGGVAGSTLQVSGGAAGVGGSGGAAGAAAGAGGASEPLSDWQFYGRWDLSHQGRAITVNSGSHITANFNGTQLNAQFDTSGNTGDIPTVTIEIDGGAPVEKAISSTLTLASGLTAGDHSVLLLVRGMNETDARWTPPLVASTVFLGFDVPGGHLVPSPRPKQFKVEFLGDSITEGVNLHSMGPQGQTTANWRTDGPRNYAALTARKLKVEWRQVGFGRQGLTVVGNGGVPKAPDAFNWIYAGIPRDDWQPDMVVINQGTNDRSTDGPTFAPLYASFLKLIRTAYPQAKIVSLVPFVGAFSAEIKAQIKARNDAGDSRAFVIDTASWTAPADFTDGLHPNQAGSVKISAQLVTALTPLLN